MRLVFSLLTLAILALGGCASNGAVRMVDLMDSGRPSKVTVATGDSIELALVENPSTGWTWKSQSTLDGILRSDGDRFVRDAANDGMVGVGGKRVFDYTALKVGQVSLEFALVGPGQPVKASDHRMKAIIDVAD